MWGGREMNLDRPFAYLGDFFVLLVFLCLEASTGTECVIADFEVSQNTIDDGSVEAVLVVGEFENQPQAERVGFFAGFTNDLWVIARLDIVESDEILAVVRVGVEPHDHLIPLADHVLFHEVDSIFALRVSVFHQLLPELHHLFVVVDSAVLGFNQLTAKVRDQQLVVRFCKPATVLRWLYNRSE